MASTTKIVKRRRQMRDKRQGSARKSRLRRLGTTPPFAIHPEQPSEPAQG